MGISDHSVSSFHSQTADKLFIFLSHEGAGSPRFIFLYRLIYGVKNGESAGMARNTKYIVDFTERTRICHCQSLL